MNLFRLHEKKSVYHFFLNIYIYNVNKKQHHPNLRTPNKVLKKDTQRFKKEKKRKRKSGKIALTKPAEKSRKWTILFCFCDCVDRRFCDLNSVENRRQTFLSRSFSFVSLARFRFHCCPVSFFLIFNSMS